MTAFVKTENCVSTGSPLPSLKRIVLIWFLFCLFVGDFICWDVSKGVFFVFLCIMGCFFAFCFCFFFHTDESEELDLISLNSNDES